MSETYKAAEVDSVIQDLTEVTEMLLSENVKLAELNSELQTRLHSKSAEADKVILEKVAAAKQQLFPTSEVLEYTTKLAKAGFLREPAEVADAITRSPGQLLKLASRILELSMPAPITGKGVGDPRSGGQSKSASRTSRELEEDGWLAAIN